MMRFALALGSALMLWTTEVHAAAACPSGIDAVGQIYASAEPITFEAASIYAGCDDPLARELGLAALADSEAVSAAIPFLIAALDDTNHSVRAQALIGLIRNTELARPALMAALDDSDISEAFAEFSKKDIALAALGVLGTGVPTPDNLSRIYATLMSPEPARFPFGPVPRSETAPQSARIDAPDFYERQLAMRTRCSGGTGEDGPFLCVGLTPSEVALAEAAFANRLFLKRIEIFDSAVEWIFAEQQSQMAMAMPGSGGGGASRARAERMAMERERARLIAMREAERRRAEQTMARQPRPRPATTTAPSRPSRPSRPSPPPPPPPVTAAEQRMPRFPWPAPKPVKMQSIPAAQLGGANATLDEIRAALERHVSAASSGYETGLFSGPPGGFVMLTRMERIQADGSPFPGANRFTTRGNPKAGFWDMLANLMGEKPGYFRVIAFVVADALDIDPAAPVSSVPTVSSGAAELPRVVGDQRLGSKRIYALVYAFERPAGRTQRPWVEGSPSALVHLRLSGIAQRLGL